MFTNFFFFNSPVYEIMWNNMVDPDRLQVTIFFSPMPPHVLMNFRGFPPGSGDSVADFWG